MYVLTTAISVIHLRAHTSGDADPAPAQHFRKLSVATSCSKDITRRSDTPVSEDADQSPPNHPGVWEVSSCCKVHVNVSEISEMSECERGRERESEWARSDKDKNRGIASWRQCQRLDPKQQSKIGSVR